MKDGLRILIVSQQFRPLVGGYERAAERLAAGLAAAGHDVTVLTERRNPRWARREEGSGFAVRRIWCIYRPRWHLLTSLLSSAVFLFLHTRRFQVVHIQQYGTYAAVAIAMARLFSVPVVLRTTSTRAMGIGQVLGGRSPVTRLTAALHRKANACIVTTAWALDEVLRFGIPRDRIRLIPNGIDTSELRPDETARRQARSRLVPGSDVVMVLYCGRLDEAKNPLGLVRAWRTMARGARATLLVLVGDGPQRGLVQQLVDREGLGDCVRLAGEQATVLPWYLAADIFVLSSHLEGLSNALLEAMSCGLPVVSTRVSGSVDIFAECDVGELVDVGDDAGLASAIARLVDEPERRKACGVRARQYAELRYSIQSVVQQTVDLYQAVIGRAGPFT